MTDIQLSSIEAYLLEQKQQILHRTKSKQREAVDQTDHPSEDVEAASLDASVSLNFQLQERDHRLLLSIERVLRKIKEGAYGTCGSCGDTIAPKRLEARPFSDLCIECQQNLEELN